MLIRHILSIWFHLFAISNALELIINPSSHNVSCGSSDDCTVICNETEACKATEFFFYNNNINITCAAADSCDAVEIHTFNITKLTAHAIGKSSFSFGRLLTSSHDDDIHFNCGPGKEACVHALFYYQNQGESNHNCEGQYSCRMSMIDAISAVSLSCKTDQACRMLGFFLSRNKTMNQQSSITIAAGYANIEKNNRQFTMKVYSLYPFNNFVSIDGTSFNAIYFIYGTNFDRFCIVSDSECMASIEDKNYDELTIIDTYIDGNQYETSFDEHVVIFGTWICDTFVPPSITATKTLYIVCIYCLSSKLKLDAVTNAVVSGDIYRSTIYGPTDYFMLNIMHYARFNVYFLNNTSTIIANSLGMKSNAYLGDSIDVNINCHTVGSPYYQCTNTHIWSTLQQRQVQLAHDMKDYWNIDTSAELIIHFNFQSPSCTYLNYSSNCSFSSTYATMDPTRNPSRNPSSATINPSSPTTRIIAHNHPTSSPYVASSSAIIQLTVSSQSNNVPPNVINNGDRNQSSFIVWVTAAAIACGVCVFGLCAVYLFRGCIRKYFKNKTQKAEQNVIVTLVEPVADIADDNNAIEMKQRAIVPQIRETNNEKAEDLKFTQEGEANEDSADTQNKMDVDLNTEHTTTTTGGDNIGCDEFVVDGNDIDTIL